MNKEISKNTLNVVLAIVVLALTVFGFFWLWQSSQEKVAVSTVQAVYQTVEIDSLKKSAEDLTKERQNVAGIPVAVPAADSIGRTNPFAGL